MGARKLEDLLETLPELKEDELAQVFSLVDKIKEERKEAYLKAIEDGVGKFKGTLSSVDDFLKNKQLDRKFENLSLDEKVEIMHNTFKNYKGSSEAFISNKEVEKLLDR